MKYEVITKSILTERFLVEAACQEEAIDNAMCEEYNSKESDEATISVEATKIGLTDAEKNKIRNAIREFCEKEYYALEYNPHETEDGRISIACTPMGDADEFEVEVYVNFNSLSIDVYRDNELVVTTKYDSVNELVYEIENRDILDMISDWDDGLEFNWIVVPYSPNHIRMRNVSWRFTVKEYAQVFAGYTNGIYTDYYGFKWNLEIENVNKED